MQNIVCVCFVRLSVAPFLRDSATICGWSHDRFFSPFTDSRTAQHILIKFDIEVMRLEASTDSHSFIFCAVCVSERGGCSGSSDQRIIICNDAIIILLLNDVIFMVTSLVCYCSLRV